MTGGRRRWYNLSLRTKLALYLALSALLPLLAVVGVGTHVTVAPLERGLMDQTRHTSLISLNLLLRQVQRISAETARVAGDPELHELVALEPELLERYLSSRAGRLHQRGLVEVALIDHQVVARMAPTGSAGLRKLRSGENSEALLRALDYERYLSFDLIGGELVIQASAPIVDSMFVLRGAVITTVPLDEKMADYIRGVVGADVGFLVGSTPVASTFVDRSGLRLAGVFPSRRCAKEVFWGRTALSVQRVGGREYALAFAPVQTVEGKRIGMMSVGVSREELNVAKASASRSLYLGGLGGLIFALVLAYVVGRRITVPISRLHGTTQAIAAGKLDVEVVDETEDEIGDLARAFQQMAEALREHEERLAARVREISTLHQIGRAVSSVISLDQVLLLVVQEVSEVLGAERGALMLLDDDGVPRLRAHVGLLEVKGEVAAPPRWVELARGVVGEHSARVEGTTLAVPLETREHVLGALVVARRDRADGFSEGDLRLVVTFCDQAATAIENARLYAEVRAFSQELERKVEQRTAELRRTNDELQSALTELKEAQSALIHSEKMAGLGTLAAGIAHEINTPAGAIQGSIQTLGSTMQRLVQRLQAIVAGVKEPAQVTAFLDEVDRVRASAPDAPPVSPTELRTRARELAAALQEGGIAAPRRLARRIVEAGAESLAPRVVQLAASVEPAQLVGAVEDIVFLERSSRSIQTAIRSIVRLVGTLKRYSHTDQSAVEEVDLTETIETTLTILHNELRYGITVSRNYGTLPRIPVYVDELNQVWTNIIQNAAQAMEGKGEIAIETFESGESIGVRITDSGPGIPPQDIARLFEPFFTTKPRGEGTGLGLSIVRQIVDKHGGSIQVDTRPGKTSFTVVLPAAGPPEQPPGADLGTA